MKRALKAISVTVFLLSLALLVQVFERNYVNVLPPFPASYHDQALLYFSQEFGFGSVYATLIWAALIYLFVKQIFLNPVHEQFDRFISGLRGDLTTALGEMNGTVADKLSEVANVVDSITPRVRKKLIHKWLDSQGRTEDVKEIGAAALRMYYGASADSKDDYFSFVQDHILSITLSHHGSWERNKSCETRISQLHVNHPLEGEGFFCWEERRRSTVICPSGQGTYPVTVILETPLDVESIREFLENSQVEIFFDHDKKFSLKDFIREHDGAIENLRTGLFIGSDDGSVDLRYVQGSLQFVYNKEFSLTKMSTDVFVREDSFIKKTDTNYIIRSRRPAEIFTLDFSVDSSMEGWVISDVDVASLHYHNSGNELVDADSEFEAGRSRSYHVTCKGWTLPGLIAVLQWQPTGPTKRTGSAMRCDGENVNP